VSVLSIPVLIDQLVPKLAAAADGDPATKTDGYLAVVRIGRVILVLASIGWETSSGDAATARTLATVAADRLRPLA
jgi:hypothetical protein